jgi:hypothetical protein
MAGLFFTTPASSMHYSGKDIANIKNGDDLNTVVEKLVSEIERLNTELANATKQGSSTKMSTDSLENKNSFGAAPGYIDSSYTAKITVTPKSNSIEVFYDLNDIGTGEKVFSRVTVDGFRNGLSALLVDTDKMSSGFLLGPDAFPSTMNIEVRRKASTGEMLIYTGTIPLSATTQSGNYPVFSKSLNKSDLKTQTEVNDFLYKEIVSLQNSVKNAVSSPDGSKTVYQELQEIKNDVQSVKNQDVASAQVVYKNGEGNVTKTLQEALNDFSDAINTLSIK